MKIQNCITYLLYFTSYKYHCIDFCIVKTTKSTFLRKISNLYVKICLIQGLWREILPPQIIFKYEGKRYIYKQTKKEERTKI